jgi:hypothetical protein
MALDGVLDFRTDPIMVGLRAGRPLQPKRGAAFHVALPLAGPESRLQETLECIVP